MEQCANRSDHEKHEGYHPGVHRATQTETDDNKDAERQRGHTGTSCRQQCSGSR